MKIIKKLLKWTGLLIGSMLLLLILSGLSMRLFSPNPVPPGKLVEVDGVNLHVHATGEKNDKPTLVIEAGAGGHSEYYHWLSEGLRDSMRVIRYDRAGIGYSELNDQPQNPETIARDLHALLENSGESPPYIMAGHSHGGHYARVFKKLYPKEVAALVLIDSGHPDEHERLKMPSGPSWLNKIYYAGAILGDLGLIDLYGKIYGNKLLRAPGVPEEITDKYKDYFSSGKYLWGYIEEEKWHDTLVKMSKRIMTEDTTPIRVFSGTHLNDDAVRQRGLDPNFIRSERKKMQEEMSANSINGKTFFLDAGHFTIFTEKENADIICNEINALVRTLD